MSHRLSVRIDRSRVSRRTTIGPVTATASGDRRPAPRQWPVGDRAVQSAPVSARLNLSGRPVHCKGFRMRLTRRRRQSVRLGESATQPATSAPRAGWNYLRSRSERPVAGAASRHRRPSLRPECQSIARDGHRPGWRRRHSLRPPQTETLNGTATLNLTGREPTSIPVSTTPLPAEYCHFRKPESDALKRTQHAIGVRIVVPGSRSSPGEVGAVARSEF